MLVSLIHLTKHIPLPRQNKSEPIFRGRKLVLNYTDGSPCGSSSKLFPRKSSEDDDDDIPHRIPKPEDGSTSVRRKSTLLSFFCERETVGEHKAAVSFVGASPDECTYFFEVRSAAACAGIDKKEQSLGPAGVFGVILLIAAVVYLLGGIAYQRTVMHQRGWRQLPNFALWAGILSFFTDIIIILGSSCARIIPRSKGYNQLPTHNGLGGRGSTRAEDENRLIDQLDEEWDD